MAEEVDNTETVSSEIPDWVNPGYSYDPANPRKPNLREMAEAIGGQSLEDMSPEKYAEVTSQAGELLYGVVGSNQDTRDFNAIMSSDNIVAAAQQATEQMYQPSVVQIQGEDYFGIVTNTGVVLRAGYNSFDDALSAAQDSFGLGSQFNTTTVIPDGMSQEQVDAIVNLADGMFLSQTTGIDQNVMNELKVAAGLDAEAPLVSMGGESESQSVQDLLTGYGYNVGNSNFYGGSTLGGPKDAGAEAYFDAYKNAI